MLATRLLAHLHYLFCLARFGRKVAQSWGLFISDVLCHGRCGPVRNALCLGGGGLCEMPCVTGKCIYEGEDVLVTENVWRYL